MINDSTFVGASFREADFTNAIVQSCDFSGGVYFEIRGAQLTDVNVSGASFRDARLLGTDLGNVNINLSQADLTGALYNSGTLFPGGFDPDAAGMINVDDFRQ